MLLFWPEPAAAAASTAVTELWHFSEDPSLGRFVPRDGKVWAIDAAHQLALLVPARLPARVLLGGRGDVGGGRRAAGSTATASGAWP